MLGITLVVLGIMFCGDCLGGYSFIRVGCYQPLAQLEGLGKDEFSQFGFGGAI